MLSHVVIIRYNSNQMSIQIALTAGYITTALLGSFCPMQMAASMSLPEPMQHVEMVGVAMTPMVPMTFAAPMSMAPATYASHTMPVLPTGNCTTGHCIMVDHAQKQETIVFVASGDVQGGAALPASLSSVANSLAAPPLPPMHAGGSQLASAIATIVLRV